MSQNDKLDDLLREGLRDDAAGADRVMSGLHRDLAREERRETKQTFGGQLMAASVALLLGGGLLAVLIATNPGRASKHDIGAKPKNGPAETAGDDEAEEAPEGTPFELYFDSELKLDVYSGEPGGRDCKFLGRTPCVFGPGIRITSRKWHISPRDNYDETRLRQLAAEIGKFSIPGLRMPEGNNAELLKALANCRMLKWLTLPGALIADDCRMLAALPELTMLECGLTGADGVREIARLAKLRRLHLREPKLDNETVRALGACKTLVELELTESDVPDVAAFDALSQLPRLKRLSLGRTKIAAQEFLSYPHVKRFAALETLEIGAGDRNEIAHEILSVLPNVTVNGQRRPKIPEDQALNAERRRELDKLVAQLSSEEYDQRQAALQQLFKAGRAIEDYIEAQLKTATDPELSNSLRAVLKRIRQPSHADVLEQVLRELPALKAAAPPLGYLAADSETLKRLSARINFDFNETPAVQAVEYLSKICNVAIAIDPDLPELNAPITLRVESMETKIALGWIMKLIDLEYIVRGPAVIIGQPDVTKRLALHHYPHALPVAAGEAPWSQQDLDALRALGGTDFISYGGYAQIESVDLVAGQPRVLVTDDGAMQRMMADFQAALQPDANVIPRGYAELERKLDRKIAFAADGKLAGDLIEQINKDGIVIELGEKQMNALRTDARYKTLQSFVHQDMTVREAIKYVARLLDMNLYFHATTLTSEPDGLKRSVFVNANAALQAGVDPDLLHMALQKITAAGGGECAAAPVRGRWAVLADAFTVQRVLKLLELAAKEKAVPRELPPLPWFFSAKNDE